MIKGFQRTSLVDYPGNIVSTVFFGGCNFKCLFCYNNMLVMHPKKLMTVREGEVIEHISRNKNYLDGVCIGGGEPTLQKSLPSFLKKVKRHGLLVKLDTNGSSPGVVKHLVRDRLVDYVALDVKAPWSKYRKIVGVDADVGKVKETLRILKRSSIDYEVRTTVVPALHTKEDIIAIAKKLKGARRYFLQQFQPMDTLQKELKGAETYTKDDLEWLRERCSKFVPTFIRAKD